MRIWQKYAFAMLAVLLGLSMYKPVSDLFATNKQYTQESFQPSSISGNLKNNVREFKVLGSNYMFSPGVMNAKKGETIRIIFYNIEGLHDFKIDELGVYTEFLEANDTQTVEFEASKVGTFEYYCSVSNHRAMGMVGKLNIE